MKIEFRLPSSKVQYGYVNVDGTEDELDLIDLKTLGRDYAIAVAQFWEGEQVGLEVVSARKAEREEIKHPKTGVPTPVTDVPLPEEDESAAADLITEKLGATKLSEEVYDTPVEPPVEPWKNSSFDFDS